MTKQEVIADAQKYADMVRQPIYVMRRGDAYKVSRDMKTTGWKLAETVHPTVEWQGQTCVACFRPAVNGRHVDGSTGHAVELRVLHLGTA